jgi:histidinol-phosphate phosphatase family protein
MQKILVIRFSSLGDVILTSPAILNLKLSFPDSHLVFLTKERFRSVVEMMDGVDEIVCLPDDAGTVGYLRILRQLDRSHFSRIVDLHGNPRSWLARRMLTADISALYQKRSVERRLIARRNNKRIPQTWPHTIDLYNSCINSLGAEVYCRRPLLHPPLETEQSSGDEFHGPPSVLIAPGAAHPNKQWEIEKFAEVAHHLYDHLGYRVFWAVASESDLVPGLQDTFPERQFVQLVNEPLHRLASILFECRLAVTNDSGLMHLASAVGTPVIAVFGPTHQALGFAPRGLFDRVVQVDEFCRPCSIHGQVPCWREERYCFTRIGPNMVYETAAELLGSGINSVKALFVDRDGTLIVDKHFLSDPEQVELIPGSVDALRIARQNGFQIVVISNQSGVARGYMTVEQVESVNARLLELLGQAGVDIDGVYFCPYFRDGTIPEYAVDSGYRKPGPGMAEMAARDLGIDLRRSIVIGDKIDDVSLGRVIGARSLMVRTGHGEKEAETLLAISPAWEKLVFENLLSAVKYVVS